MHQPRASFTVLAVLLCAAPVCFAQQKQPNTGSAPSSFYISGTVRHADNNRALEMIKIDLKRSTGETVATNFTRSNGEFEFGGVPRGAYQIVIDNQAYEPLRENIEVQNMSRPGVMLLLTPKRTEDPRVVAPGDSISAHQLSMPHKAQDAYQKGMQRLYDKDDAKGSIELFQHALAAAPDFYEAYLQIGVAYAHLSQMSEAEAAFRKSVETSQERFPQADFNLAALLSNTNRFAEAEPYARRGATNDPTDWKGHFELARALAGLGKWDEADKSVQEAHRLNQTVPAMYLLMANVHIHKQNYTALLEDLDTYLKLEPDGPASAQARSTRDQVQKAMANGKPIPPNPQP
jgi:tetratricopeptide (TPR) repeat protein